MRVSRATRIGDPMLRPDVLKKKKENRRKAKRSTGKIGVCACVYLFKDRIVKLCTGPIDQIWAITLENRLDPSTTTSNENGRGTARHGGTMTRRDGKPHSRRRNPQPAHASPTGVVHAFALHTRSGCTQRDIGVVCVFVPRAAARPTMRRIPRHNAEK